MQKSRRLKGLDGLKAFGCVVVAFFWHYQHFGSFENSPLNKVFFLFYQSSGIAVELFFMLSGFTM
jgi:peptidoglycan/LPS O-acetylase OafA/YrhL